jgi:predicted MFS family arabinose efflux permease
MVAASGMTTLGSVPVFLLSAQAVRIREELGFGEVGFGIAVGCFFGAAAATAFAFSFVVDAAGRRLSTIASGLMGAGAGAGTAVMVDSYMGLVAAMAALGMANATLQLTANLTLARVTPRGRQGLAFGVKQSAVPLAILVGGLAVPTIGELAGWRWTFAGVSAGGLVVALGGWRIGHQPRSHRAPKAGRQRPPMDALVLAAFAMALASAAVNSLGAFLPSWGYAVGLSPSQAGLLIAAGGALAIISRVWSGHMADLRGGRHFPVVVRQLLIGAAGLGLLAMESLATLVPGALLAFGIGWAWPGLLLFAVVRIGRDAPAAAAGTLQSGAFAGGALGPMIFGLVAAGYGYPTAWLASALALGAAAVILVQARRWFVRDLRCRPLRSS